MTRAECFELKAGYLVWGDLDKPFHRPECSCHQCEAWRTAKGRATHAELMATEGATVIDPWNEIEPVRRPPEPVTSGLFRTGDFLLASGARSSWKIDCDALTPADWEALAVMLRDRLPPFGTVEGVPRGGLSLAKALTPYATSGPLLIVDDVWTTGGSWEKCRAGREVIGAVVFARGQVPPHVTALFQMGCAGRRAELMWTAHQPTAPGYYWWRRPSMRPPPAELLEVRRDEAGLFVPVPHHGMTVRVKLRNGGEWAGPLEPPA